jgi:hypothetical protein
MKGTAVFEIPEQTESDQTAPGGIPSANAQATHRFTLIVGRDRRTVQVTISERSYAYTLRTLHVTLSEPGWAHCGFDLLSRIVVRRLTDGFDLISLSADTAALRPRV